MISWTDKYLTDFRHGITFNSTRNVEVKLRRWYTKTELRTMNKFLGDGIVETGKC